MTPIQEVIQNRTTAEALVPPLDKKEWAEKKERERQEAFKMVRQVAENCRDNGTILREVLNIQSRCPQFSTGNILLIAGQMPSATDLQDYATWKERGGFIRRGAAGVSVFHPGSIYTKRDGTKGIRYDLKKVFDISQVVVRRPRLEQQEPVSEKTLTALFATVPCPVKVEDLGQDKPVSARYLPEEKVLVINHSGMVKDLMREVSREAAMAFLSQGERMDGPSEFIAKGASYILCRRWNIPEEDSLFHDFPKKFRDMDAEGVKKTLSQMRYLSHAIQAGMDSYLEKERSALVPAEEKAV
ncbi:MAG: hypothetical protein IJ091_11225 [Oscillospiraceae bacterium]|nr:hypothetical protein [Oscillospiraceae bacterium]